MTDPIKKTMLLDPVIKRKCELIGVLGRRCFHLFDKTHLTWVCSVKQLGYEKLTEDLRNDTDTEDEGKDSDEEEAVEI